MQQTTKQTAPPSQLDIVIGQAMQHVPLTKTEVHAWRLWWPRAVVFDILLMRKRNGGLLHTVVTNKVVSETNNNGSTAA